MPGQVSSKTIQVLTNRMKCPYCKSRKTTIAQATEDLDRDRKISRCDFLCADCEHTSVFMLDGWVTDNQFDADLALLSYAEKRAIRHIREKHPLNDKQARLLLACDSGRRSFEELAFVCMTSKSGASRMSSALTKHALVYVDGFRSDYCDYGLVLDEKGRALMAEVKPYFDEVGL